MKRTVFKKSPLATLLSGVVPALFTLAVVVMVMFGLNQAGASSLDEGAHLLEESILRAAIHCYAIEGYYPENLIYITDNYGIYIDNSKYAVHYDIFVSNMLPDITVITLNQAREDIWVALP